MQGLLHSGAAMTRNPAEAVPLLDDEPERERPTTASDGGSAANAGSNFATVAELRTRGSCATSV